jgi:vacuolar-type H+-ATPase subunit F/Vma7
MTEAHLTVVSPPEMEPGFRLAGAAVRIAADASEAARAVTGLIADGERGVIAVYEPYLAEFDPVQRNQWEASLSPVIVALPAGLGAEPVAGRRSRLAGLLQRAVGYHIAFGDEEQP